MIFLCFEFYYDLYANIYLSSNYYCNMTILCIWRCCKKILGTLWLICLIYIYTCIWIQCNQIQCFRFALQWWQARHQTENVRPIYWPTNILVQTFVLIKSVFVGANPYSLQTSGHIDFVSSNWSIFHYGIPIWDPIMGYRYEIPLWDTDMRSHYGIPIWDPIMGYRYEIPLWDTDMRSHYAKVRNEIELFLWHNYGYLPLPFTSTSSEYLDFILHNE